MSVPQFFRWLLLVWVASGVAIGEAPTSAPATPLAYITAVKERLVRLSLMTPGAVKKGDTLTVLDSATNRPVAHLQVTSVEERTAEAVTVKVIGLLRVGDSVVAEILPLPPLPPEQPPLPSLPETQPLVASVGAGRLDLPSALPIPRHAFVEVTTRRAELEGRKLQVSERLLHLTPQDRFSLWYGKQDITVKGRDPRNRFDTSVTRYGFRYLIQVDKEGENGLALSYERFRPTEGTAVTGNTTAVFRAPKANMLALLYSDRGRRLTYHLGLGYGTARVPDVRARVLAAAGGVDVTLASRLSWQLNVAAFEDRWLGGTLRTTVFFTALAYTPVDWARLELSAGYTPKGFPVAGTPLAGLSSFMLYQPGGLVHQFSGRPAGFYTLRLLLGTSF